jgi:hypothetical protein
MKAFVPERAIVPKLLTKSALVIPIPVSIIVSVLSFLLGKIFISNLGFESSFDLSVRASKRILSQASEALEISSRRKISLFEYSAFMIKLSSWLIYFKGLARAQYILAQI